MSESLLPEVTGKGPPEETSGSVAVIDGAPVETEKQSTTEKTDFDEDLDWNLIDAAFEDKDSVSLEKDAQDSSSQKSQELLEELLNEEIMDLESQTPEEKSDDLEEKEDLKIEEDHGEGTSKGNEDIQMEEKVVSDLSSSSKIDLPEDFDVLEEDLSEEKDIDKEDAAKKTVASEGQESPTNIINAKDDEMLDAENSVIKENLKEKQDHIEVEFSREDGEVVLQDICPKDKDSIDQQNSSRDPDLATGSPSDKEEVHQEKNLSEKEEDDKETQKEKDYQIMDLEIDQEPIKDTEMEVDEVGDEEFAEELKELIEEEEKIVQTTLEIPEEATDFPNVQESTESALDQEDELNNAEGIEEKIPEDEVKDSEEKNPVQSVVEESQESQKSIIADDKDFSTENQSNTEIIEESQEAAKEFIDESQEAVKEINDQSQEAVKEINEESQEAVKEMNEESQEAVKENASEENNEKVEEVKTPTADKSPKNDDDDVVLIEEDEPTEGEKSKEPPAEEKAPETSTKSEKTPVQAQEEGKVEEEDDDVIEIPEDEPAQETEEVPKVAEKKIKSPKEPLSETKLSKSASVTEENSSVSMDLESNDVPSEKTDTIEDDSTPMDMEVDETANAEWPVDKFKTQDSIEEKQEKNKHYDCINLACKSQNGEEFAPAQGFIVSFYSTKKRKKTQYVCQPCHQVAMEKMMEYCNVLTNHKPIFHHFPQHTEVVEISDSSEDSSPEDELVQTMRRPLSEAERQLIEKNLDEVIISTMEKVKINQQFEWTKQDLEKRFNKLENSHSTLNAEFQKIQKIADGMFKNLNSRPPIHIYTEFPAPDDYVSEVNYRMIKEKGSATYTPAPAPLSQSSTGRESVSTSPATSPGEVKIGSVFYGMRTQLTKPWNQCEVIDKLQANLDTETRYQVKFLRHNQEGILTGKQLAFSEAPTQKLPVGTRVLAMFSATRRNLFYPGIVAEPTQETNRFRYLVFFDDGYVQYVHPSDVRRICSVSENVWEDVHPGSRDFIKSYLQENQYQRAVAQVKIGQKIEVERNGKWVSMRVAKVDCSLILVYFAEYTEWIYSGSQRLLPIYRMKMDSRLSTGKKLQTRNEPYVSFRNVVDDSQRETEEQSQGDDSRVSNRSVAKKSTQTTQPPPPSQPKQLMNNSTIFLEDDDNHPKGKVVFYTAKFNMPPKSYTPHMCNSECLYRISYDLNLYNPLAKPLLSGWERKIYRVKTRRYVIYKAPCGRSLRGIEEVHKYLRLTDCNLNVDNYDFDPSVHCLAEYVIDSAIVRQSDISNSVETMPIACVNCYDETVPPPCIYANHRIPTEGVHLNLDPEFLVGCDCTDDCMDKSKCSCWNLTAAGVRCLTPNVDINTIGYTYKK
uniref:Uncharacterized protein n=1 Tax=Phlebotomus papatasi TaxID=29031 RepID=A0A1B0DMP7_PHLPP